MHHAKRLSAFPHYTPGKKHLANVAAPSAYFCLKIVQLILSSMCLSFVQIRKKIGTWTYRKLMIVHCPKAQRSPKKITSFATHTHTTHTQTSQSPFTGCSVNDTDQLNYKHTASACRNFLKQNSNQPNILLASPPCTHTCTHAQFSSIPNYSTAKNVWPGAKASWNF